MLSKRRRFVRTRTCAERLRCNFFLEPGIESFFIFIGSLSWAKSKDTLVLCISVELLTKRRWFVRHEPRRRCRAPLSSPKGRERFVPSGFCSRGTLKIKIPFAKTTPGQIGFRSLVKIKNGVACKATPFHMFTRYVLFSLLFHPRWRILTTHNSFTADGNGLNNLSHIVHV